MVKIIKKLKAKEIGLILLATVFIVFQVWLDLKLPDYMTKITTLLQTSEDTINEILKQGAYMLACALGSLASSFIVGFIIARVATGFSKNLRREVFEHVENLDTDKIKKFSIASLITRTTNDVNQLEMFLTMGTQLIIKAPIMAFWAIGKILNKGWQWSAITGAAVIILLIMIITLFSLVLPKFKIIQKLIDNVNNIIREHLIGIKVVRAFNAEKYQENKFNKTNKKLADTQTFAGKVMSIMSPGMTLIMSTLTLAIYFIGAYLINKAAMLDKIELFSNMVVFSSYAMQVIMSFIMLTIIFMVVPRASVSAKRILEVLESKNVIKEGKYNILDTKVKGKVEFKNVSFKYPDAEECLLENISFVANEGETIAIIGSTGSGKSTLINLIPRFYDVTSGEILIDDINVKKYNYDTLYKKIGYVPQKSKIFSGSIKNNVSFGESKNKETPKLIRDAIKIAQAKDFVEKMEQDYDSIIAEDGTNLSGGQKQRLSIARTIARSPEIFIFDDSFSALDYKTDYNLRKELKKATKATNIIVAQRIGTIIHADKIIVLESGKCVGIGTHKELLKTCQVYQEIAYSQLSKEELHNA